MNELLIGALYFLHILIFLTWIVPFFIPTLLWKNKIKFQFYFMASNLVLNSLWGLYFTFKIGGYHSVCFLTSIMQKLRGHNLLDPANYNHSFVAEVLSTFNINLNNTAVGIIMVILFAFVSFQYLRNLYSFKKR
jgi:hypothetical protein